MPAAHDIYVEQLFGLDYGTPLYYPEPDSDPNGGPMEIGDVGFVRQGMFIRLFNVTRSGNDPRQLFGVPKGFQPLTMGRIRTVDSALRPGPLKSETVVKVDAGVGIPSTALPLDASFHFKCTSDRGAVLFQETEMKRELIIQDLYPDEYLKKHCDAWLAFASEHHIGLSFGEMLLVTECSKTGAWASAVYSESSKEFGISFSVGSSFSPYAPGVSATAVVQHVGSIQERRSAQCVTDDGPQPAKDHTVFFRAARLATRELYRKSLISIFMHVIRKKLSGKSPESQRPAVEPRNTDARHDTTSSSAPVSEHEGSLDMITLSDLPDFHPAIPLLALEMENTDAECVVVYDDAWCHLSPEASQVIEDYRQFHFEDYKTLMTLALDVQNPVSSSDSGSQPLLPAGRSSLFASEDKDVMLTDADEEDIKLVDADEEEWENRSLSGSSQFDDKDTPASVQSELPPFDSELPESQGPLKSNMDQFNTIKMATVQNENSFKDGYNRGDKGGDAKILPGGQPEGHEYESSPTTMKTMTMTMFDTDSTVGQEIPNIVHISPSRTTPARKINQSLKENKQDYRSQKILDVFQLVLDTCANQTPTNFQRNLVITTQMLAAELRLYPASYELSNITIPNRRHFPRFIFDSIVLKGYFRSHPVYVKATRIFRSSSMSQIHSNEAEEAVLWRQLRHPNLLPFYGTYRCEGHIFFVSPWMENGTIRDYLKRWTILNRVVLAYDAAKGLEYLHRNGIIHGNLTGKNVLVNNSGRACIAEFGLCSISDERLFSYSRNVMMLRWLAPELLSSEERYITPATDMYAWASVAYEIFAGKIPFAHLYSEMSILDYILSGGRLNLPPASAPSWSPWGLTKDIWALMETCWDQQPEARPSAQAVMEHLVLSLPPDVDKDASDHPLSPEEFRKMNQGSVMKPELSVDRFDSLMARRDKIQYSKDASDHPLSPGGFHKMNQGSVTEPELSVDRPDSLTSEGLYGKWSMGGGLYQF